ncbi:MAG TPA: DCC1-like thiol-disulfide oxidoreductase family protein [Gemmatimonadaceae bacterium]
MRRAIARAVSWWQHYWFEPAPPTTLAVSRIILCAGLLFTYWQADFSGWAAVSPGFWEPVWLFKVLDLGVLRAAGLRAIEIAFRVALVLALVGLFTRAALAVLAVLSFYYFGLQHNFGHIYHFDALVAFTLTILALSRAGDAWSLDAWIRDVRMRRLDRRERPAHGEYTWVVKAVWLAMALVFFAAGTSKLRRSGIDWITSDTLALFLTRAHYHVSDADPLVPWGLWIAQHPSLVRFMAAMTIIVEAAFPLALVVPRLRWFFVPAAFGLLLGIRVLMGPTFGVFLLCNAFWVDWHAVLLRVRAWFARRGTIAVIYDGDCGLCTRTAAGIAGFDILRRVELCDLWRDWDAVSARYPALDQEACAIAMHAVESGGRLSQGFTAFRRLLWYVPVGWLLLPIFYVPGIRPVGERVYAWVAARRARTACAVPSTTRST